jgi:hypothetical protein
LPGATIPKSSTSGPDPQPEGLILAAERSCQVVSSALTDDDPRRDARVLAVIRQQAERISRG